MGFLSRFRRSVRHPTRRELEQEYAMGFEMTGMPSSQAQEMARKMVDKAFLEAEQAGELEQPANLGDRLVEGGQAIPELAPKLKMLRNEGVTDADIRWYYNLHPVERRLLRATDQVTQMAAWKTLEEQGKSEEEIVLTLKRNFPWYGDPSDTSQGEGENRPLPIELRDRITRIVERRALEDRESFKIEIQAASTFNAWVRQQMRQGKL